MRTMRSLRTTGRLRAIVLACILGIFSQPSVAAADGMATEGGLGAVAAISSLIYGPIKITYCVLGVVFGGMAYGLSGGDSDVLDAVITPAVRGDYVITPSVIRGERSLEFIGRDPDYRRMSVAALPPPGPMPGPDPVTEEDF